jgi:dephospho-CoA kinase
VDGLSMLIGQADHALPFFRHAAAARSRCRIAPGDCRMSRPFILGLTGSIGMGKSAVALMLREMGVPVFDADAAVHACRGRAARSSRRSRRPSRNHRSRGVLRQELGARVFGNPGALARLEAIVHPAVGRMREAFLIEHAGQPIVVFDIPLLFEKGHGAGLDAVMVVSAPPRRNARASCAAGHDAGQVRPYPRPASTGRGKRARADFIVDTGVTLEETRAQVAALVGASAAANGKTCVEALPVPCDGSIYLVMREIVFDTETTGLDPRSGDRLVEIGCIEMVNRVPTGAVFHAYFNPERGMPAEAEAVHGLSEAFLSDKPKFGERAEELIAFLAIVRWWRTTPVSISASSITNWRPAGWKRWTAIAWSIRSPSPGASIPAPSFHWMRCARAMASTGAIAPSTAPCWTRNCWRSSTSNSWVGGRSAWNWPQRRPLPCRRKNSPPSLSPRLPHAPAPCRERGGTGPPCRIHGGFQRSLWSR